jgi:hypothetical protein
MLAENKETAPKTPNAMSPGAPTAEPARARSSTSRSSDRRAKKRASRRAAPPRTSSATNLVNFTGEVNAEGEPVVSASQTLIDLEIRRSMREARRVRDKQLQEQQAQAAEAEPGTGTGTAEASAEPPAALRQPADHGPQAAAPANDEEGGAEHEATADASGAQIAQPRQHAGPGQSEQPASANPLNQHLSLMTQQLTAAHRVIGRVSAERDALRQQVADLQGIPVEEVVLATVVDTDRERTPSAPPEPETTESASRWSKLNYFGGEDVAQMRRRRQAFVLTLIAAIAIGGLVARQIGYSMPEDISKDSLAALPVLGNFMYVFLAGWMLFRVVKVSSKGVRWIFPSEDRRRRRR